MKEKIHPEYLDCTVTCACGMSFKTRSTRATIRVEMCNECHPFYTGKQKFVDAAGRVERFTKKYQWGKTDTEKAEKAETPAAPASKK